MLHVALKHGLITNPLSTSKPSQHALQFAPLLYSFYQSSVTSLTRQCLRKSKGKANHFQPPQPCSSNLITIITLLNSSVSFLSFLPCLQQACWFVISDHWKGNKKDSFCVAQRFLSPSRDEMLHAIWFKATSTNAIPTWLKFTACRRAP